MRSKIENLAAGCASRLRRLEGFLAQLEHEIAVADDPDMLASVELLIYDLKSFESMFDRIQEKFHTQHFAPAEDETLAQFRRLVKHVNANPTNDTIRIIEEILDISKVDAADLYHLCILDKPIDEYKYAITTAIHLTEI